MDFTTIKAGEQIEIGHVIGFRFWRYRLHPLRILSWVPEREWCPGEVFEADAEPAMVLEHGIHAYKTIDDYRWGIGGFDYLFDSKHIREFDGLVRGTVKMWGVVIEHKRGYRAQYAQPASFDEAYGERAYDVLPRLRRMFGV